MLQNKNDLLNDSNGVTELVNDKKNNIVIILVIVIGLLVIVSILLFVYNNKDNSSVNNNVYDINSEESGYIGYGGDTSYEEFYDWETKLNIRAFELFNEVFPQDYDYNLEPSKKFSISMKELKEQYGINFDEFNMENVSCDLEHSIFTVQERDGELSRSLKLSCINLEEINQESLDK